MSVFLHRISHHSEVSYPLLDRNILSTGWGDLANSKEFIEGYERNFHDAFVKYYNAWWRSPYSLEKYLNMHEGDRVVVPSWGCFHVYEITGKVLLPTEVDTKDLTNWHGKEVVARDGYLYADDKRIDLGFFRTVKVVERGITRNRYAEANLVRMLKFRGTTNQINQLEGQVNSAIQRYRESKPLDTPDSIITNESIATQAYDAILKETNPATLETFISTYFKKIGASSVDVHRHGDGKDGDADIVATFEQLKTIFYVQAKKHGKDTATNAWAVSQIKEYINRDAETNADYANVGMVISTATKFSDECEQLAQENGVVLINGLEFAKMILGVGLYGLSNQS